MQAPVDVKMTVTNASSTAFALPKGWQQIGTTMANINTAATLHSHTSSNVAAGNVFVAPDDWDLETDEVFGDSTIARLAFKAANYASNITNWRFTFSKLGLSLWNKADLESNEPTFDSAMLERIDPDSHDDANLVGSLTSKGTHKPVLDIDFPVFVRPSKTEGHFHLFLDKEMSKGDYAKLVDALVDVGVLQQGIQRQFYEEGSTFARIRTEEKNTESLLDSYTSWAQLLEASNALPMEFRAYLQQKVDDPDSDESMDVGALIIKMHAGEESPEDIIDFLVESGYDMIQEWYEASPQSEDHPLIKNLYEGYMAL